MSQAEQIRVVSPLGDVVDCPLGKVRPYPQNPRVIPPAAVDIVAKSIVEFGWKQPLVVDAHHVLIVGHVRYLAARALQLDTVPVVVATDLSPAQVAAYRIADNRTHDYTSWDLPELIAQLDELSDDFADVLGLADWESIVGELEQAQDNDNAAIDESFDGYLAHDHELVVACETEEARNTVAAALIDMPGVLDVRNKR